MAVYFPAVVPHSGLSHHTRPNLFLMEGCRPCNFYCSCCQTVLSRCGAGAVGWEEFDNPYSREPTAIICGTCLDGTDDKDSITEEGCTNCIERRQWHEKRNRLENRSRLILVVESRVFRGLGWDVFLLLRDYLVDLPRPPEMKIDTFDRQTLPYHVAKLFKRARGAVPACVW